MAPREKKAKIYPDNDALWRRINLILAVRDQQLNGIAKAQPLLRDGIVDYDVCRHGLADQGGRVC